MVLCKNMQIHCKSHKDSLRRSILKKCVTKDIRNYRFKKNIRSKGGFPIDVKTEIR